MRACTHAHTHAHTHSHRGTRTHKHIYIYTQLIYIYTQLIYNQLKQTINKDLLRRKTAVQSGKTFEVERPKDGKVTGTKIFLLFCTWSPFLNGKLLVCPETLHYRDCQLAVSLNGVAARAGYNQTGKRNLQSVLCSDWLQRVSYIYTVIPSVILFFNIPVTIHSPDSRPPRCVCACVHVCVRACVCGLLV